MKWMERLNENIKKTVRSWLNVLPANPFNFQINEMMGRNPLHQVLTVFLIDILLLSSLFL